MLTGSNEDNIQIKSKQDNSKIVTCGFFPGIYTYKDLSEYFSRGFEEDFEIRGPIQPNIKYDKSDSIIIHFNKNTMKSKMILRYEINALRFDEKSFFSTISGFSPYWDYKSFDENFGEKFINLSTIDKIHVKCDVIDGSAVNKIREPILFKLVSDKPP